MQDKPEYSTWIREKEWKSGGSTPDSLTWPLLSERLEAPTVRTLNEATFK
jgi:hypothetical protein